MFCGVATKRGLIATVVVAWGVLLSSKEDMKEAVQWLAVTAFTVAVAVYVMHTKKSPNSLDLPAVQVPPSVRRAYPIFDSARDGESFSSMCETLIVEAVNDLALYEVQPSETNWILEMLRYNVQGGKMNRGLMVVSAGRILFDSVRSGATNDDLCRCAVLGWCIEFLQAWLLIADDYMDSSVTRRGRQCWYRVEGVDKIAINDAFLTEMIMFKMLKRHFGHMSCYNQLVDLLLETTIQTEVGQLLDLRCAHVDLDSLTVDRWTLIVQYKTAYYSFYLPVAMAMILAGITDRSEYDAAREILLILGIYFQAQDDFLDAFGDPKKIGKIGTGMLVLVSPGLHNVALSQISRTKSAAGSLSTPTTLSAMKNSEHTCASTTAIARLAQWKSSALSKYTNKPACANSIEITSSPYVTKFWLLSTKYV